ncbi:hypothetical protein EK21DRAFT_114314 [Setomelanomma holmii]|uniref:Peptidase M12A domain-containing protein n=1 Tax=Setomelanomma holmii TaxID=210430 RepID=A0A9P4H6Q6_9PLEO|nr:hypothetical protein EK21DRAFT_114314 [Setomelanomma holmii]
MHWLLLPILATVASVCPPLFNDFQYLGNKTHSTADLVRDLFNKQPDLGWAEIITNTGYPVSIWPTGKIAYCFSSPEARGHLESHMNEAWALWHNALGVAGEQNGHTLEWSEYPFWPSEWPYCFEERRTNNDLWVWNHHSVAMIWENTEREPDFNPSSVTGFIVQDWPGGKPDGRMGTHYNLDQALDFETRENWIATIAHEMGHVFSLWHEHQRPDRNHWVWFNCEALPGYENAKNLVESEGMHDMNEVCNNGALAARPI